MGKVVKCCANNSGSAVLKRFPQLVFGRESIGKILMSKPSLLN